MIYIWKVPAYDKRKSKAEYERWLSEKAHDLLWQVLRNVYQIKREKLVYKEYGKPCLSDAKGIEFNITHCDGLIALVVGDRPAGIDAEKIRPWSMAAMRKVCDRKEAETILESERNEEMFFRYFTLKEAYGKAAGFGLSYPLKEVTFQIDFEKIECSRSGYCFSQYLIENEYVLSVCYERGQEE